MALVLRKKINLAERGFTMLEMLVVTAIVLIMSGIIIAYIPQFRDRSSLDLVAQEMALNIRSAQAFASGGRVGGSIDSFAGAIPSYGISLSAGEDPNFFMFTDEDNSKDFDGEIDKLFEGYDLQGIYVDNFRFNEESSVSTEGDLYIVYTRPRLQAYICYNRECEDTFNQVEITIRGGRSETTRTIRVHNNGQISILPTSQ